MWWQQSVHNSHAFATLNSWRSVIYFLLPGSDSLPTFNPAWSSLPVLPGSHRISNLSFSLLSPALSHPSFPIVCHTRMQPRPWEPSSISFPRFCPLLSPIKAPGPPKALLKPPGAEAPLLAWWISVSLLFLSAHSQHLTQLKLQLSILWEVNVWGFLTFCFCWAAMGFFSLPFSSALFFSQSLSLPFCQLSLSSDPNQRQPLLLSLDRALGDVLCPYQAPRTCLHPPLGELCLQSSLSYQTMYAVVQTSFVYCQRNLINWCACLFTNYSIQPSK